MAEVLKLDQVELDPIDPLLFEWDGHTYTTSSPQETDIRRLRDIIADAERDPTALLKVLLGDEQYEQLDKSELSFTGQHLMVLVEAWTKHHKLDLPKSSGSPKSSRSTAKR